MPSSTLTGKLGPKAWPANYTISEPISIELDSQRCGDEDRSAM